MRRIFFGGKIGRLWLRRAISLGVILGLFWQGVAVPFLFAAGDTKTWNFTTPSDYTVTDGNLAEVAGNTAKLKVQEYTDDANTSMLLHLNESSGNPADSASPTGSPQASGVTYSAGKLNNAANFDGSASQISVADSTAISLNNSHTIETWANLSSAFTANSTNNRLPIFDKGSHQMYFDKDTGELVYEAALANQTTWSHVAGPISSDYPGSEAEDSSGIANGTWDYNGKATVSAITHIGSNLYVGLGQELADAEVWKFNGTSWSMIGGDKLRSSWDNEKYEIVSAMAKNGNTLYVGLGSSTALNDGDAEVWSLDVSSDSNQWVKVGGDGANSSWNYATAPTTQGPFEIVNVLHYAGGALYAGLGSTAAAATNTDSEVWRFNGSSWTKVGGDQNQSGYGWSGTVLYENVLSMTSDGTYLYVGMGSTVGDGDVWRATLASLAGTPSWAQIGGDGTGWAASTFEEVRALYAQGSYVYAGLGNSAAGDAEVYRYDGSSWTKIGECASTSACTTLGWQNNLYEQVWSIWGNGTLVYVGLGNTAGDNDIWQFNDAGTSSTADDVWTQIGGSTGVTDYGATHTHVRTLYHDGTNLYGGLGAANNATGELWKYNGSQYNWTIVGGNYINDSWGYYAISRVESMITGNGKLYVGLGATTSSRHGSALVWQFDGTTWTRIGGQGKNGSWNGTLSPLVNYESVASMAMYSGHLYVGLGTGAGDAEVWGWEVMTANTWTKVGGDGGIPVAVASSGTGNRAASSNNDGITSWTHRTSAADTSWSSVTYGNDRYVAVSSSGVTQSVMTSPDGANWTIQNAASDNAWQGVTFGEGLFVAVASSGTNNRVMTSPDGVTWTSRTTPVDNNWKAITYGNGTFVAVANSGTNNRVMTSPNGIDWSIQTTPADLSWNSIAYGNGLFVAVANDGVLGSVMTSTNGTSWTQQNASVANAWQGVAFGRGVFAAIASSGTSNRAMTSTDGVTWTTKTTPVAGNSYNWSSITFNHSHNNTGRFTAIANGGAGTTQRIMTGTLNATTTDTTWAVVNFSSTNSWNAIASNGSWSAAANIESVQSMTVHDCPGTTTQCLYVGLGATANTDSKVYAYDSGTWQQVGGYGTVGSWEGAGALNIEAVNNLTSYKGKLYAGLGNTYVTATNGDAELWEYSTTGTAWTKVAGDGVNSSWSYAGITANGSYEAVNTTSIYSGDLYVGLGTSSNSSDLADAEVWKWSGSGNWTKVGGDGLNSSWDNSQTYESVRSMAVYNGELYVGLGDTSASGFIDSEVWKWNGTIWTRVGGDNAENGSWPDTVTPLKEQVYSLATYNGKLFAGLGNSVGDAAIWTYGGNAIVRTTTTTTQPTGWRHIAAVYDQSAGSNQMKIYIDGVEKGSTSVTSAIVDNSLPLLIGTEYGTRYQGEKLGFYNGSLDEIRLSGAARSTSALNLTAYTNKPQGVRINSPHFTTGMKDWTDFDATETVAGEGIKYRLSIDGGTTWKYWDTVGGAWATSVIDFALDDEATILSKANDKATIDSHINTLSAGPGGIAWQAILNGDGTAQVTLSSVSISGTIDVTDPTNPTLISAYDEEGGTSIIADTWYPHSAPYFSWSGATDPDSGSGVYGYYVDFEEAVPPVSPATAYTCSGDPQTQGDWTTTPEYTASGLTAGKVYCLRIKTKDYAGNVSDTLEAFQYRFDNSAEVLPDINPIPGFINDESVTFTWAAITSVNGAPIQKLQYKTGAGAVTSTDPRGDAYADWQDLSANATSVTIGGTDAIDKASYQNGSNVFYLRIVDVAGNIGTPGTEVYNSSGEGPSAPQGLTSLPATTVNSPADTCSFTFTWDPPATYDGGDPDELSYCYRVNGEPDESYCADKFTAAGVTSATGCFAGTGNGTNIFYVVARNSSNWASTINYAAKAGINFYLDTAEPGPPVSLEAADTSQKSLSKWKIGLSWQEPELNGDVVDTYRLLIRTEDGAYDEEDYKIANDPYYEYRDLTQVTYYMKVKACDQVGKCGAYSDEVFMLPTGKFTEAAVLVSGPTSSAVTTKKATISWGTDRTSDSKIQYGTSSGDYFTEEPSNSIQVTAHEITLNNLSAGTTYYYKAKWTDEDGNTGSSGEKTFTTEPAPSIKDAVAAKVGISNSYINFTSTGSTKIKIYYGETAAFGNVKTISTSTSETTESVELTDLKDDTKYYYKINAVDADGVEYDGTTLSFTTLPRPRIAKVRVQQIAGTAQPAILVSWSTNTSVSSIVTYYPTANPGDARDEVNVELTSGEHQMIIRSLYPKTPYTLIVSGRDKAGNEAKSDRQSFTTATDTRPPKVTNMKIEGSVSKVTSGSNERLTQLIVSWTTDEPATSQVEYGEGTSTSYPQKTQEDAQLKVNHLVVISNLPTSRVYHLRASSKDSVSNVGTSIDTVTITPKGSNDALDLVMSNMLESFGFLRNVLGQ